MACLFTLFVVSFHEYVLINPKLPCNEHVDDSNTDPTFEEEKGKNTAKSSESWGGQILAGYIEEVAREGGPEDPAIPSAVEEALGDPAEGHQEILSWSPVWQ